MPRAGNAEAFAVFFARHSRVVLGFVRRRVGSAELAADLTAEAFAAALIAVHRGADPPAIPDGAAWLCGIARYKIIDSYREGRAEVVAREQLRLERLVADEDDLGAIDRLVGFAGPVHLALNHVKR